ncbi:hypothetical protein BGX31_000763 [Mortierella sp. GBA43]|nr:hypothetical protein BGX31_000763 [Mortierella sp. GBA43]
MSSQSPTSTSPTAGPNAARSNLPSRRIAPEALLSPTIEFPKPRSLRRSSPGSGVGDQLQGHIGPDDSDNDEDDDPEENDNDLLKKSGSKSDPLAAQVWRLYSLAKDTLPNAQRLENLTWRMMAMTLHQKNMQSERGRSFTDATAIATSSTDTTAPCSSSPVDMARAQASPDTQTAIATPAIETPLTSEGEHSPWFADYDIASNQIPAIRPHIPSSRPLESSAQGQAFDDVLSILSATSNPILPDNQLSPTPTMPYPVAGTPIPPHFNIPASLTNNYGNLYELFAPYTPAATPAQLQQVQHQVQQQAQLQQQQLLMQAMTDMTALDSAIHDMRAQENPIAQFAPLLSLDLGWQQQQQPSQGLTPLAKLFDEAMAGGYALTQPEKPVASTGLPSVSLDGPPWGQSGYEERSQWWQDPSPVMGKLPGGDIPSPTLDLQDQLRQPARMPLDSTLGDSDTEDEDFVPTTSAAASSTITATATTGTASTTSSSPSTASLTAELMSVPPTQCTHCSTKTTPLWRRDQDGNPLCNACGLFLKLHGRVRPLSLKTDVIKKRNRVGLNSKSAATGADAGASTSGKQKQKKEKVSKADGGSGTKRSHHDDKEDGDDRQGQQRPSSLASRSSTEPSGSMDMDAEIEDTDNKHQRLIATHNRHYLPQIRV